MPNLLECGRIINTHGVRGELKVEPWCDSPDLFGQLTRLYVGGQPYQLETARPHKSFMLCKLAGIDSLEQAMALKNQTLFLDRAEVPLEEGAYFIADILGFEAYDRRTESVIGALREIRPAPSADLYCIEREGREILIPAVPAFVHKVDFANKRIEFDTIQGMLPDEN